MLEVYSFIFSNIWTYIGTIGLIFAVGYVISYCISGAAECRRYNVLGELLEDTLYDCEEEESNIE